jgi:hypothetical protein
MPRLDVCVSIRLYLHIGRRRVRWVYVGFTLVYDDVATMLTGWRGSSFSPNKGRIQLMRRTIS